MQYDFICVKCRKKTVLECSIKEYDNLKEKQFCPKCNGKMKRILSNFGLVYKCGGFYHNSKRR